MCWPASSVLSCVSAETCLWSECCLASSSISDGTHKSPFRQPRHVPLFLGLRLNGSGRLHNWYIMFLYSSGAIIHEKTPQQHQNRNVHSRSLAGTNRDSGDMEGSGMANFILEGLGKDSKNLSEHLECILNQQYCLLSSKCVLHLQGASFKSPFPCVRCSRGN